jgi:hypothetical protein
LEFLDGPDVPAAPALASGASPLFDLTRRLTMIMNGVSKGRLSRGGLLSVIGLGALALAFAPAFSGAQEEPARKERPNGARPERPEPKGEPAPDRPRGEPKDRVPPKDGPVDEEIEKLRKEMAEAREEAEKAMARVRALQQKMMQLGAERGRGVDGVPPPFRREGGGVFPMPPIGGQGGERQFQEMQRQIEEMRKMIEELRRDLRPTGGPKGPTNIEIQIERPDNKGPKDAPRRKDPNQP